MRNQFKVAAGFYGAVLLLAAGCQSTVRTETRFLPPTAPDQLACVDRCYQTDRDCVGSRSMEPAPISFPDSPDPSQPRETYDQCSKRTQADYEQCQSAQRNSGSMRGTCYREICLVDGKVQTGPAGDAGNAGKNDAGACAKIFNACFNRCGGRIETREVCEGVC